jgi:hypothetical protein
MEPLRVDQMPYAQLASYMGRLGAVFMPDRSNDVRHVYFSRRLNRWFAASTINNGVGTVRVSHYAQCPCGMKS